ncbi:LacI family DNA-binding transcriptional regulator [Actinopolymorpha alba]|uniref:LacI family DNA-binding transcriptional regulator n=1 Tax=Actinopolymorpha alba TaxID=533267 RepID=UPI00037593B6|nr:LacI family DNA-binding transcriptional regulator [Actinopolymorpha alba]
MTKLTIRDIARLSGLSKSTVSLVLNNSPRVDPATRERVLEVMRSHNYVPNFAATALARGNTRLIGMIVPGLTWRLVAAINYGVASVVEDSDYEIILYTSTNDRDYGRVIERILASKLSTGLLVVTHNQPLEPLEELQRGGLPVVLVDTLGAQSSLPSVVADNYGGAHAAVRHLVELGHRRIACIEGPMEYQCCLDRTRGYTDALREAGIAVRPELVTKGEFAADTVAASTRALLDLPKRRRPTAIFAHSDITAYAVMEAVEDAGLKVPDDISIVGFDDLVSSEHVRPALTTIRQPFEEMGQQAARLLLSTIDPAPGDKPGANTADEPARISLSTSLIIRDSCTTSA